MDSVPALGVCSAIKSAVILHCGLLDALASAVVCVRQMQMLRRPLHLLGWIITQVGEGVTREVAAAIPRVYHLTWAGGGPESG